jgi:hypothetical protein
MKIYNVDIKFFIKIILYRLNNLYIVFKQRIYYISVLVSILVYSTKLKIHIMQSL